MRRLRHGVEAAAFGLMLGLARVAPRRVLLALGAAAGTLGFLLDRRHRRVALDNLRLAYGDELTPQAARRLVLACWRHFGRVTLDTLCFPRLGPRDAGRLVRYEGLNHLRRAYEAGRGVLIFTGHYGHWELAGLMQGYLGFPLAVVARPLDNPRLERMLARLRQGSGNRVIYKRNAVREMVRELRGGRCVAIVIDQDARGDGVFVPFFGRPASTTPTLARLALRTGAPVIPCFATPEPDGGYRVRYGPPVDPPRTGDRERDVREFTARCTAIIERRVRERPELWLWMHRRFKTRPAGEGSPRGEPARGGAGKGGDS